MNVFRTAENLLEKIVHQTAVFQRINLCRAALLCAEAVAAEVFKAALVINFDLACGKIVPAAKIVVCGLRRKASRSHAVCAAEDLQTSGELRLFAKNTF